MPDAAAKGEYGDANPWIIAVLVAIATFMEVLDTTIANVALRYISGGLAVSADEASWVITTYLVANSIVLCASGWIAEMFGRKNFFLVCIALFTASSLLCGFAWNLQSLLVFRVIQGLAGGGMTPVAQSILAAAFPPAKRSQGFALYGIAVVVAPGPQAGRKRAEPETVRGLGVVGFGHGHAACPHASSERSARVRLKQNFMNKR